MVRSMVRLVKTKNCFVNLPPHVARGVAGASEVCACRVLYCCGYNHLVCCCST